MTPSGSAQGPLYTLASVKRQVYRQQNSYVVSLIPAVGAQGAVGKAHVRASHKETAIELRPHQPEVRQWRAAWVTVHLRRSA